MGNFEKLSVLVIVVIIVMILVVALYTWSDNPDATTPGTTVASKNAVDTPRLEQPGNGKILIPVIPPTPGGEKPLVVTPGQTPSQLPPIGGPGAMPTVPAPEVKSEPTIHEIVAGDSFSRLAKKYHVTVRAIEQANPEKSSDRLRLGDKLTIPEKSALASTDAKSDPKSDSKGEKNLSIIRVKADAPSVRPGSVYTFVRGDTLPSLSKRAYGTADRWHEIWIANYAAIENPDVVAPGTRVTLPAK